MKNRRRITDEMVVRGIAGFMLPADSPAMRVRAVIEAAFNVPTHAPGEHCWEATGYVAITGGAVGERFRCDCGATREIYTTEPAE